MNKLIVSGRVPKHNLLFRFISFSWVKKSILVEIIALWFVILFLYTGIAKLMDFAVFKAQLEESPVLESVAPIIAWSLPFIEFVVCFLLFFPRYRLIGLYASLIMMVTFTAYVIILLITSPELPCSCGGIIEALSWQGHLIFNSVMVLLSVAGIRMQKAIKQNKISNEPVRSFSTTNV